mgnify:CR=1 FL=1
MSYQSIAKPIMQFLSHFEQPKILEIGVDKGQTAIPLCHNLTLLNRPFLYDGVDILVQESVVNILTNMSRVVYLDFEPKIPSFNVRLFEKNSLYLLPKLAEKSAKYNLILLDGDHNYHTVYNELLVLDKLTLPSTLIVCDDYNTRWAHKDMFYSEREEYSGTQKATNRIAGKKKGVKAAIEDFVAQSEGKWSLAYVAPSDYCILYQPLAISNLDMFTPPGTTSPNWQILEVYFNKEECPEVKGSLIKNLEYVYSRKGDK